MQTWRLKSRLYLKSPPCSRQDGLATRVFRNQYYKFLSYIVIQYCGKVATSIKFFPNTY